MEKNLLKKYEELFGRKLEHIKDDEYLEYNTDEGTKKVSGHIIKIRIMETEGIKEAPEITEICEYTGMTAQCPYCNEISYEVPKTGQDGERHEYVCENPECGMTFYWDNDTHVEVEWV